MKRFALLISLFVALVLPSRGITGTPGPGAIEGVDWAEKPSAQQIAPFRPIRALDRHVSGWAVVICKVKRDGYLRACQAAGEGPEGYDFGAAAVAAASRLFRMTQVTPDGRSTEGAVIMVPMEWHIPNRTIPVPSYSPGQPAYIAKVAEKADKQTLRCPTKTAPNRQCRVHMVNWTASPSVHDFAPMIRTSGDEPSRVDCRIGVEGRLEDCKVTKGASEVLTLTEQFRAAPVTIDGLPTSGERAIITFDWKALRKFLTVYHQVYETQ